MSEKWDDEYKPILVIGILAMTFMAGALLNATATRRSQTLTRAMLTKLSDGHVYKVSRRNDGVWDIRSTTEFAVAPSCSTVMP